MKLTTTIIVLAALFLCGCQEKKKTKEDLENFSYEMGLAMAFVSNANLVQVRFKTFNNIVANLKSKDIYPKESDILAAKEEIASFNSGINETLQNLEELGEFDSNIPLTATNIELVREISVVADFLEDALLMIEKGSSFNHIEAMMELKMKGNQENMNLIVQKAEEYSMMLDKKYAPTPSN